VRDARHDLERASLGAVGISPDAPAELKVFKSGQSLGFPLLSDPNHKVASDYGAWGEKSFCGKTVTGIIRSSFLIDAQGKVIQAWYGIRPEDTIPRAIDALEGARSR